MIIKNFYGGELSAYRRFLCSYASVASLTLFMRRFARQKTRRLIWLTFPLFPALRPAHYDAVRRMRATYARINKRRKRAGADVKEARAERRRARLSPLFRAYGSFEAMREKTKTRAGWRKKAVRRKRAGASKNQDAGGFARFFADGICGARADVPKNTKKVRRQKHLTFAAALLSYLRLRRCFGIHALFKERTLRTRRTTKNIHTPSPARNTTSMPTIIHTQVYVSFTEHTVMSTGSPPASSLARSVET